MIKINKYLDTENLIKRGKYFDWKRNIGKYVHFVYDDIEGNVFIKDYKSGKLVIEYENNIVELETAHFLRCQFGKLLNKITTSFRYEIGEHIKDENRDITITNMQMLPDISNNQKMYKKYQYKCNICSFDCRDYYKGGEHHDAFWTKETALRAGVGCSCCAKEITVVGINDIPTTDPWMMPYFQGGEEEAKKYSRSSNKKIIPICPECHQILDKKLTINGIYTNKSIGCICSDGFSYPEKFIANLLQQLNVNYIHQLNKSHYEWCNKYKYDFYLTDYNFIIEAHGMQHYKDSQGFQEKK